MYIRTGPPDLRTPAIRVVRAAKGAAFPTLAYMANYRSGDEVKVRSTVHSSSGSGYPGDRGRIDRVEEAWGQDVYRVRLDNGVRLERVRETDLERV